MRYYFSSLDVAKKAAKRISVFAPDIQLSAVKEGLSRSAGYRNWHELESECCANIGRRCSNGVSGVVDLIFSVATELDIQIGDAQYALSFKGALGSDHISIDAQQVIFAKILREKVFGSSISGRAGALVRVRSDLSSKAAYFIGRDPVPRVLFDSGLGIRADSEVRSLALGEPDFVPARLWFPYGFGTTSDGSEVVFSRDYWPLWRISGGSVHRLDPWKDLEFVSLQSVTYFCDAIDANGDWLADAARQQALVFLNERRVTHMPRLAGVMPFLFEDDVPDIASGVERLRDSSTAA